MYGNGEKPPVLRMTLEAAGGLLAAKRLEPAADVHLGVSFATIVPCMGLIGRFLRPFEDRQLRVAAMNHDPLDRPVRLFVANLTSIDRVNHSQTSG